MNSKVLSQGDIPGIHAYDQSFSFRILECDAAGSSTIHSHDFRSALLPGWFPLLSFLRKKSGDSINEQNRIWIIVGATAGALIGSRLVGAFEDPHWLDHPTLKEVIVAFNNKTIVGGLFGGILGVELVKKIIGEKQRSGDLFVFPIITAIFIGRIGCFLTALDDHTAGNATTHPWGVDYGDGIPRHPLPLYEMLFLAFTFFMLYKLNKRGILANGSLFKLFMLSYFAYRFFNELLKHDYVYPWKLTMIETVCVVGILYYTNVLLKPKKLLKHYA